MLLDVVTMQRFDSSSVEIGKYLYEHLLVSKFLYTFSIKRWSRGKEGNEFSSFENDG